MYKLIRKAQGFFMPAQRRQVEKADWLVNANHCGRAAQPPLGSLYRLEAQLDSAWTGRMLRSNETCVRLGRGRNVAMQKTYL